MTVWLLLGSVWILLALVLYLATPRWLERRSPLRLRRNYLAVALVALTMRLVPDAILPTGALYDIESYALVADVTLEGKAVYAEAAVQDRHPYLPLHLYWLAFSRWTSRVSEVSFVKIVRLAPILADVAIAVLLCSGLAFRATRRAAFASGLAYALNPVSIYVSAYHGQFDAIPALLLLLALRALPRSPSHSAAWLSLGIWVKSWPVLALPGLLSSLPGWRKRLIYLGIVIALPWMGVILYSLLFGVRPLTVILAALSYNHGVGIWGYTYPFRLLAVVDPALRGGLDFFSEYGRYLTLLILGAVWWFVARRQAPALGALTILVVFLAATHAFSIQYLSWVVPLALFVRHDLWLRRFTIAAFAYMFLAYNTLILDLNITHLLPMPQADWFLIMPAGIPAWLVTLGWARRLLMSARQ